MSSISYYYFALFSREPSRWKKCFATGENPLGVFSQRKYYTMVSFFKTTDRGFKRLINPPPLTRKHLFAQFPYTSSRAISCVWHTSIMTHLIPETVMVSGWRISVKLFISQLVHMAKFQNSRTNSFWRPRYGDKEDWRIGNHTSVVQKGVLII